MSGLHQCSRDRHPLMSPPPLEASAFTIHRLRPLGSDAKGPTENEHARAQTPVGVVGVVGVGVVG